MRLWALLPFLAIALALSGPPAFAQPATPPGQERSEEAKRNKDEKKEAQEAKKEAKKGETEDPGDGGGDGGDEDDGDGGEGDGGGGEGDDGGGDEDQGETGGEPDGGASGGHDGSGGPGSGGEERPTDGSGSADEGRRSPLIDDVACVDACTSAQDGAARERDGIRAATGGLSASDEGAMPVSAVEVVEGIPSRWSALTPANAVDGNPAVLALLTLSMFLLLVGLAGGLRALRRLAEG